MDKNINALRDSLRKQFQSSQIMSAQNFYDTLANDFIWLNLKTWFKGLSLHIWRFDALGMGLFLILVTGFLCLWRLFQVSKKAEANVMAALMISSSLNKEGGDVDVTAARP